MKQKPLLLRIQDPGPNPQKVAIIIEELGLPYTIEFIKPDTSANEYNSTTSNGGGGGAPPVQDKNTGMIILTDPNTNITLWESLALIEYLIATYDTEHKLSFIDNSPEHWHARQWLAYQMGAQSPSYSLKAWFSNRHGERVGSVIERFADDVRRIVGIMEHYLEGSGTGYLVVGGEVMGEKEAKELLDKAPQFKAWHESLMARPAVKSVMMNPDLNAYN